MGVKNSGNSLLQLRTLFDVGAIGVLSDGQLLEQFATGRGEPRELAFAALVERHGPLVLRVCRAVQGDQGAAEDAFQATFLALARKAGSLWAQDSLAPWLHQAAYRAAVHDRSATTRRRLHERAAAALRPEPVAPPHLGNDDDLANVTKGVGVGDKIVVVGIRQVADGEKVEYEFRPLEEVLRILSPPPDPPIFPWSSIQGVEEQLRAEEARVEFVNS